ncbi:MAG: DNA/RNA non-specific endonuclease [Muribaculaceae bacterium]|nr:DNA/RNA non-specific endonuclease [Muribaculaceae bacterium]
MKKSTLSIICATLLIGSTAIMAETGVVVYQKDGSSTFFPADNVEKVEFVDQSYEPEDQVSLTSAIKNLSDGAQLQATAVVTAQSDKGLILTDKAGSIFYYNAYVDLSQYPLGTVVKVSGTVSVYGTGLQLTNSASLQVVGETDFTYPEPTLYTGAMVNQAVSITSNVLPTYISLEGQLSISGNYYNINIPGSSYQGSFYTPINAIKDEISDGKSYVFTGYFTGVTSGKYFYMVLTDVTPVGGDNNGSSSDGLDTVEGFQFPLAYVALPDGTPEQVKEYTGFTLNFNKNNHTANYVSWELMSSETDGSVDRKDYNYWVDSSLEGCLDTDYAYSSTGYERGHLCPAADQKWSVEAMSDCMVMANMSPMLRSLNSGMWSTLENKERVWARRDGKIWIVAGPIYYDSDDKYIGRSQARVPSAYFKAFLYYDNTNPRAIAFVMQNGSNPGDLSAYAMSIDDLEKETGYDFFSALPDDIENAVESSFSFADWNK